MRWMQGVAVLSVSVLALTACGKKETATAPEAGTPAAKDGGQAAAPADLANVKRKPGLWSISTTSAGMTQTMRLCTDAATEEKFAVWGGQATRDMCAKQDMTRAADGSIRFTSVCDMGSGGKTTTEGVIRGDFSSKYSISAKTMTEGAGAPQMNGEHDMTMEATWLGPCPADFKAGDMELAGGYRFNMMDAGAMSAGK